MQCSLFRQSWKHDLPGREFSTTRWASGMPPPPLPLAPRGSSLTLFDWGRRACECKQASSNTPLLMPCFTHGRYTLFLFAHQSQCGSEVPVRWAEQKARSPFSERSSVCKHRWAALAARTRPRSRASSRRSKSLRTNAHAHTASDDRASSTRSAKREKEWNEIVCE